MRRQTRAALTAAGFTGAMGTLVVLIVSTAGFTLSSALLSLIVFALLLPMATRAVSGRLDVFEPIVLSNIALGTMFVGRPLADLIGKETIHLGYDVLPTFNEALFVALVGIAFFQLGYFSLLGVWAAKRLPSPSEFRPHRAAVAAWVYLLVGGCLFAAFLSTQGGLGLLLVLLRGRQHSNNELFISSTGYFFSGILMWAAASLIFFVVALATKRKLYWLWFLLPTLSLLVFYGAQGTRSNLLPLALAVPVFWYLRNKRRPRMRTVLFISIVGIALLGWLRDIREVNDNRDFTSSLVAALSSPLYQAVEILGGRDAEMFDSLANELLVVPEHLPFQHGSTITDLLTRAVPRPMWPDKPLESNDALVNVLWPEHYALSRASPAFSVVGVAYADSGYASLALVMLLIGATFSAAWSWLRRHVEQPLAQMIYAMGLPFTIILMRGTIPDTLSRMLFQFVPLVLLIWVTRISFLARTRAKNSPLQGSTG